MKDNCQKALKQSQRVPLKQTNKNQVNWVTKKTSTAQHQISKHSAQVHPRQVRWNKESMFTLFPQKCAQNKPENYHRETASPVIDIKLYQKETKQDSLKSSCERRQKLTVVSKRMSLRKISDFRELSLQFINQKALEYRPKVFTQKNKCSNELSNQDNELSAQLAKGKECKKKKIRISLRSDFKKNP